MAGKRGRRRPVRIRKPGAGRPKLFDSGPTPEVVAKRRRLAGDGDPAKTATPLDILETRGLITPAQSDAGRLFGWLRRRVYGRTETRALDLLRVAGGSETADPDAHDLEHRYHVLSAALAARGARIRAVTAETCIYNRLPIRILIPASREGRQALDALREGLDCLDRARGHTTHRPTNPNTAHR